MFFVKCPTCKKEFSVDFSQPWNKRKKYCSLKCWPSNNRAQGTGPKAKKIPCPNCSKPIWYRRKYCDDCVPIALKQFADDKRVHRPEEAEKTRKGARKARERNAVGLNQHERRRLLTLWVSQARECSYCYKSADTIDHLVPLFRGGTNEITNLVPSCRPCNSSKGSKLISEWKPNVRTNT